MAFDPWYRQEYIIGAVAARRLLGFDASGREDAPMRMVIWLGATLLAATAAQAADGGGRVLTPSDVVAIRIVDHPDLDWTTRVEPDGTINFPCVGRIRAAGRTEDSLAHTIERRLIGLGIIAGP
jgi:polysaccharide export outer membrane protein